MEGLARNARPDLSGDGSADGLGGGAGAVESGACRVARPLCQCQQEMLAAHITVAHPFSGLYRILYYLLGLSGKPTLHFQPFVNQYFEVIISKES